MAMNSFFTLFSQAQNVFGHDTDGQGMVSLAGFEQTALWNQEIARCFWNRFQPQ